MSRVAKGRLILGTGFLGIVLSLFDSFWFPLGVAGAALATIALIAQYRGAGAEVFDVTAADWTLTSPEFFIDIAYKRHGRRRPQVTTSQLNAAGVYEQVICDVRINFQGDVRITAGDPFDGRIEIA
jgi:hypothetical protein